jgi:hypothetical protein
MPMPEPGYIPPFVDVMSHCHAGYVTACGLLVLQRRGFTTAREAVMDGRAHISIRPDLPGWLSVEMRSETAARTESARSETEAELIAARFAGDLLGRELRPAPFTAAYMYQARPAVGTGSDRIVSPLHYQPGSDTVRIAATNVCVASFPDGTFASARVYDDGAGSAVWPHIEQALARGFHDCDRREGDDYCKRRLAWLAGATWLDKAEKPLRCAVLTLAMTRPG